MNTISNIADQSMNPLVSICCITYNHVKYISQAIEGFLMQKTDFAIEILINDDASTDGTTEIIKEYQQKYPDLIKPVFHEVNEYSKGIRGILMRNLFPIARGKYIAICEGDDYWTDQLKLKKQVDFLEKNILFSCCWTLAKITDAFDNIYNDDKAEHFYNAYPRDVFIDIEQINLPTKHYLYRTLSIVFRKTSIKEDFSNYKYACDTVLFAMLKKFGKLAILNSYCCVYRVHSGGVYSSSSEVKKRATALGVAIDIFAMHKEKNAKFYLNVFRAYWYLKYSSKNAKNKLDERFIEEALSYYSMKIPIVIRIIGSVGYYVWKLKLSERKLIVNNPLNVSFPQKET
jgi:glycosyltransferase involved in cell wall biosynthesis